MLQLTKNNKVLKFEKVYYRKTVWEIMRLWTKKNHIFYKLKQISIMNQYWMEIVEHNNTRGRTKKWPIRMCIGMLLYIYDSGVIYFILINTSNNKQIYIIFVQINIFSEYVNLNTFNSYKANKQILQYLYKKKYNFTLLLILLI